MKQINNNFKEDYYLTIDGKVLNKENNKFIKIRNDNTYKLRTIDNKYKTISLKNLYKLVYQENYCIDNIEDLKGEQWQVIERSNSKYQVSNLGRVKSFTGYQTKILRPQITKKGYQRIEIVLENQRTNKFIHRLVAAAFLEQPERLEDIEVHHKDFNKLNNKASNLIYLTKQQHHKLHNERSKSVSSKSKDNIYTEI